MTWYRTKNFIRTVTNSKSIDVKQKSDGSFEANLWFIGQKWHLCNMGTGRVWMWRHDSSVVWAPIKCVDGERSAIPSQRLMTHGDDSLMGVINQLKFQLLRLKFQKPTPTFNEQHIHYFETSRSMVG